MFAYDKLNACITASASVSSFISTVKAAVEILYATGPEQSRKRRLNDNIDRLPGL
jgi:hypothetical protein